MRNSKKENISKIFSEFKVNNMNSYGDLYKEYYSTVYGIIFPILKNKENSEDVTQEVFMKIYNMKKENLPEKGELSWLYTVSKNEAFQFLRKNKTDVNIDEIYELKEEKSDLDKIIDINTYNKIISPLNDVEKQIVSLKILSDFTFKKIGQLLLLPTATVQWKYYKAVNSLKISIGNFIAFLVTFIILISRKSFNDYNESKNRTNENISNNYEKSKNIKQEESEKKINYNEYSFNYDSSISNSTSKQSITGITSNVNENIKDNNFFEPFLISISSIFLIISLIFAIFFKKYQQKRIKKTSK